MSRAGRATVALNLLCAGLLLGCGMAEPAPNVRTTPGLSADEAARLPPPPRPSTEAPPPPEDEPFADRPSAFASDRRRPTAPAEAPAAQGATPAAAADAVPEEKKRDLGAELKAQLGQPVDCLDLQKVVDGGGKLTVRVGAYVGPSGRITRATVSAPGQPATAASCIERRAVAIKMQDPIEDAPRLVEAELTFDIVRTPNPPAPAPTPPPPPPTY